MRRGRDFLHAGDLAAALRAGRDAAMTLAATLPGQAGIFVADVEEFFDAIEATRRESAAATVADDPGNDASLLRATLVMPTPVAPTEDLAFWEDLCTDGNPLAPYAWLQRGHILWADASDRREAGDDATPLLTASLDAFARASVQGASVYLVALGGCVEARRDLHQHEKARADLALLVRTATGPTPPHWRPIETDDLRSLAFYVASGELVDVLAAGDDIAATWDALRPWVEFLSRSSAHQLGTTAVRTLHRRILGTLDTPGGRAAAAERLAHALRTVAAAPTTPGLGRLAVGAFVVGLVAAIEQRSRDLGVAGSDLSAVRYRQAREKVARSLPHVAGMLSDLSGGYGLSQ